jgi:enterochelin esterase family protein
MSATLLLAAALLQTSGPLVHADHTITFRLKAPNAQKVTVNVEGKGDYALTKDEQGIWTVTTKPLPPDIYGYTFGVDGTAMFDPANPQIKTNLIYVGNMVTVPGSPPEVWEVQKTPHGDIHHHFYFSNAVGSERDFYVYTPPGFEPKSKLPVLYLLHGYSDMANGWTEIGKAHVILDNLIAQKKATPMVIVMPLGYGVDNFVGGGFPRRERALESYSKFGTALLNEIRPFVERTYHTRSGRDDRAIAGLSMGGAESLYIGLNNLDDFGYIGAFSSGGFPAEKPEDVIKNLKRKDLEVFWMSCGTEDGLIGFQRGFATWAKAQGLPLVTNETPGTHEWPLWRRNLAEFSQKLFK